MGVVRKELRLNRAKTIIGTNRLQKIKKICNFYKLLLN
jgi:hypothetical protein